MTKETRLHSQRLTASEALELDLQRTFGAAVIRAALVPGCFWCVLAQPTLESGRVAEYLRRSGVSVPGHVVSWPQDTRAILQKVLHVPVLTVEIDDGVATVSVPANKASVATGMQGGLLFAACRLAGVRRINLCPV